jgi:hypothetical protein
MHNIKDTMQLNKIFDPNINGILSKVFTKKKKFKILDIENKLKKLLMNYLQF